MMGPKRKDGITTKIRDSEKTFGDVKFRLLGPRLGELARIDASAVVLIDVEDGDVLILDPKEAKELARHILTTLDDPFCNRAGFRDRRE